MMLAWTGPNDEPIKTPSSCLRIIPLKQNTFFVQESEADLGLLQHPTLTIITKRSILYVAAVVEPALTVFFQLLYSKKYWIF